MNPRRLPWEGEGAPAGVGVCLSGGGIRAAAFALGAIQSLQAERGLLFGPGSARFLSVVSGGSYVGATFTLNAARLASGGAAAPSAPPLADGSPEAAHLVANGEYLRRHGVPRTAFAFLVATMFVFLLAAMKNWTSLSDVEWWMSDGRRLGVAAAIAAAIFLGEYLRRHGLLRTAFAFLGPGILNFAAFLAIFIWIGTMLATYAWIADDQVGIHAAGGNLRWVVAGLAIAGGVLLFRGLYKDGGWGRFLLPLAGLGVLFVCAPSLLAAMKNWRFSSDLTWWTSDWRRLSVAAAMAAAIFLAWWLVPKLVPQRVRPLPVRFLGFVAVGVPRAAGLLLLSLMMTAAFDVFAAVRDTATTADSGTAAAAFWGVLIGGLVFQPVAARASLHRPYRDRLASCFAVARENDGVVELSPTEALLSKLAPPVDEERAFPRLLIFATANVKWKTPDGRRLTFAPFVFSHDRCGIPGVDDASVSTAGLEGQRAPGALLARRQEPLLSLMTGVATTGAAVSPSMGKRTLPPLRPLIALANVRLGRWLPNPLSGRARRDVDGPAYPWWWRWTQKRRAFGSGYDEFLPELLGLNRADAARIYVSDGGHYDNLGLLPLLWARCSEIWCIDSEADEHGNSNQLQQAFRIAKEDLRVTVNMDLDCFRATSTGLLGASHAVGWVRYSDGAVARLVVVKLGLTEGAPQDLLDRRSTDSPFPHHSTFRYQIYEADRMDAYRKLGAFNARRATGNPRTQPSVAPPAAG